MNQGPAGDSWSFEIKRENVEGLKNRWLTTLVSPRPSIGHGLCFHSYRKLTSCQYHSIIYLAIGV